MNQRREAEKAPQAPHKATGHREVDALRAAFRDAPVRELLVAGGLRGFTENDIYPERAA